MNAIKSIEIQNFQSHILTQVVLAPNGQLTVITGQTDSGKTAIFRALRWLLYNTPQGSDFIRAGCKFCRVTFEMESGHSVIREMTKTASKNQYRIVAPDTEKPIILEGFGRSVPLEVQELIGVRPVTIGDTKYNLNMSEQLDGPFLGSSISAPDRAKILGKLAGTEILDHAGKQAGTDIYRQTQVKDGLEADIEQLSKAIASYDYLPGLANKIAALEAVVTDIKTKQERLDGLKDSLQRLNQIDINICCCNITLDRWKSLDVAADIVAEIMAKADKTAKLRKHQVEVMALYAGIIGATETINRLEPVAIAELNIAGAESQLRLLNQLISIRDLVKLFDSAIRDFRATVARLGNVEKAETAIQATDVAQSKLNQLLDKRTRVQTYDLIIDSFAEKIKQLSNIDLVESAIDTIFENQKQLSELWNIHDVVKPLTAVIKEQEESIIFRDQQLSQLGTEYQNELAALGVCPLCGNVLNPKAS